MGNNLDLWERVRSVPENAQKTIGGGRLKGMTDINPMWRYKILTELFGKVGEGWSTCDEKFWLEPGADGEMSAFCSLRLVFSNGESVFGIGGSKYISKETTGLYTDDECYKKAFTDAISVACKQLGIGADIYWSKDATKYTPASKNEPKREPEAFDAEEFFKNPPKSRKKQVLDIVKRSNIEYSEVTKLAKELFGKELKVDDMSEDQFQKLLEGLNGRER